MERQMDALGRIVLPAGYRKQKNLQAGDVLCVDEQEGKRSFPKLKILYPNPRLRYFQNTLLCGYSESSASSWLPLDKESVSSI